MIVLPPTGEETFVIVTQYFTLLTPLIKLALESVTGGNRFETSCEYGVCGVQIAIQSFNMKTILLTLPKLLLPLLVYAIGHFFV